MVRRAKQLGHAHVLQLGVHGPGCAAQDEEIPYCRAGDALAPVCTVQFCRTARLLV